MTRMTSIVCLVKPHQKPNRDIVTIGAAERASLREGFEYTTRSVSLTNRKNGKFCAVQTVGPDAVWDEQGKE
jgi:hypothetical protein